MSAPEPTVVRTWNRDGTTNVMGLDAAVENVARNQSDGDGPTGERGGRPPLPGGGPDPQNPPRDLRVGALTAGSNPGSA
jgi:hypothetical protein